MVQSSTSGNTVAYISLGIAIIALAQPWACYLAKRRWAKLLIRKLGALEIGFSEIGPTISLSGTLCAKCRAILVEEISIILESSRNGAVHSFTWVADKPPMIHYNSNRLEIPRAFYVNTLQEHAFNILCVDKNTSDKMTTKLSPFLRNWKRYYRGDLDNLIKDYLSPGSAQGIDGDKLRQFVGYGAENGKKETLDSDLLKMNYWKAGHYKLELTIITENPQKTIRRSYGFNINKEQESLLADNATWILMVAGLSPGMGESLPMHIVSTELIEIQI